MAPSRVLAVLLGYVVFLVNPGVGCSGAGQDEFEFDAEDMKAAVEGTWAFSPDGAATPQVTFSLQYGPSGTQASARAWIRPAAACTSRSFVAGAAACVVVSTMGLSGQTTGSGIYTGAVTGQFSVYGTRYTGGSLSVKFSNGDHLEANVSPMAAIAQGSLFSSNGAALGAGQLHRLTP
jgi:hypothetical protein